MTPRHALLVLLLVAGCGKKKAPVAAGAAPARSTAAAAAAPADDGSSATPAQKRLTDAAGLLASGRETDALKARGMLDKLVVDEPKNALAWFNLGVVRHRFGAVVEAAEAFGQATKLDGSLAAGWRALGQVELELGEPDLALRHLDKALGMDADDVEAKVSRAAVLRALGRAAEAVEAAKEALRLNAKSLPAYTQMGLAHLDQGRVELARFVFEKAETVEGAESDPTVQANFGWALYKAGERYAAETRIRRAVELDPSFVPGLVYLARLHLEDHAWADAAPLLEKARERAPRNHGVLVDLGVAYRGLGRADQAKAAWEQALSVRPGDPTPLFDLGLLLADAAKDYDGAIAKLEAYVAAGGAASDEARAYIDRIQKDKAAAERQKQRDAERAKRDAEKAEREKVLAEAAKAKAAEEARRKKDEEEARKAEEAAKKAEEPPPPPPPSPWTTSP